MSHQISSITKRHLQPDSQSPQRDRPATEVTLACTCGHSIKRAIPWYADEAAMQAIEHQFIRHVLGLDIGDGMEVLGHQVSFVVSARAPHNESVQVNTYPTSSNDGR